MKINSSELEDYFRLQRLELQFILRLEDFKELTENRLKKLQEVVKLSKALKEMKNKGIKSDNVELHNTVKQILMRVFKDYKMPEIKE